MKKKIYVWSVTIKPLRKISIPFEMQRKIVKVIPWVERIFRMPVHTFVTIDEQWLHPPVKNVNEGYWFCAGDFCSTDEKDVFKFKVDETDINFACCLAKPDIKLSDPKHEYEVIGGSYLLDFVCHNITNRILYASKELITLINTSIPLTGYKAIVNSPLSVYGRNKREWELAIYKCGQTSPKISVDFLRTRFPLPF